MKGREKRKRIEPLITRIRRIREKTQERKRRLSRAKDDRVESSGRLAPIPPLPLVKPDVRIFRIRLSCKRSSLPTLIRSVKYTFSPVIASGKRECMGPIVSLLQQEPFAPQELPCFPATTIPSDSRRWGRWSTPTLPPSAGSLRFIGFSFPTRCLQPPRGLIMPLKPPLSWRPCPIVSSNSSPGKSGT